MKKLKLVAVVVLFTVATGVNAQDKMQHSPKQLDTKEQTINKENDQSEKLNLTPEQKAQIKEIRKKREAEKKELQTKLKDLRVSERIEINKILTEEQRVILKEKKEMKHENLKVRRGVYKEKMKEE